MDTIQKTVGCGCAFKATKLAIIDLLSYVLNHPTNDKAFKNLRQDRSKSMQSTITEQMTACTFSQDACIAYVNLKLLNKDDTRSPNDEKF